MFNEASFAEISAFMDRLKVQAAELLALEGKEGENALGFKISEAILLRHPFEVAAMLLSTTYDLVKLEAEVKELKGVIASWENPGVIPAGPVADAIDHFLAHPETGVRRSAGAS